CVRILMDRKRKDDDTLPGSLQSLRGEYEEIKEIYRQRRADMAQAQVNSSGIGLLVTVLIRINRERQKLLTYGLSEHYRNIFQITRLDDAIGIYDSEEEAVRAADSM
ncbi:MAG TPA: hypothetical protein VK361_03800, partial [Rubrobacteraceae bacterium]|nr:hypothetical protein [Rubrobacteraceae bacterium]